MLAACLAVEAAMSPEERRRFLANTVGVNPNLLGAKVADVLDMMLDHDAYLDTIEMMYEGHREDTELPTLIPITVCAIAGAYGKANVTWERVKSLIDVTRPEKFL